MLPYKQSPAPTRVQHTRKGTKKCKNTAYQQETTDARTYREFFKTQNASRNVQFVGDVTEATSQVKNICSIIYMDNQAVGK